MQLAIIVPVYNAQRTVGDTLHSLQQIEHGWEAVKELVLCDDASTDDSLSVIQSGKFSRCPMRVMRHDRNKGEAAAYMTMVNSLSEDVNWFLILHADDLALPCFITRNLEIIKHCDERVASVSSNYYNFNQNGQQLAATERECILFRKGTKEDLMHSALLGCWWHISGALVNKRLWVEFGGRNGRLPYAGDWDLLLRWQSNGYTVAHSVIATTRYRLWESSSVSASSHTLFRDLRERTKVALGLPEIFHGKTGMMFAFVIFKGACRRGAQFLVQGKIVPMLSVSIFGFVSFAKLLLSSVKERNSSF
jgi:glycosyltransferase involved in cell wall biosynthesis